MSELYLRIALPSPLRRLFDYRAPAQVAVAAWQPGVRVRVPFGRRELIGILVETANTTTVPDNKIKDALELLDQQPLLPPSIMRLCLWAAQYYQHSLGDTFSWALPTLLRQGEPAEARQQKMWLAKLPLNLEDPLLTRAPKQLQALKVLAQHSQGIAHERLEHFTIGKDSINALHKKGLVTQQIRQLQDSAHKAPSLAQPELPLNDEQQAAFNAIHANNQTFKAYLLAGVTGSGKTEVYLQLIREVLAAGKQVLVLIPEINLGPQTLERFTKRFNARIALLHSNVNDRDRLEAWLAARSGHADIIIGTRSALFTPLSKLGLIIIDEEHDASYKQQEGLRYHARDLALVRARAANVPIVLGSATPCLESLHNAHSGRFALLRLTKRAGGASQPKFIRLDVRSLPLDSGISAPLQKEMRKTLEAGQQVLVFLNRRGFAPVLMCNDCGWMSQCNECDARLTFHQRYNELRCHHCGHSEARPHNCPSCSKVDLRPIGAGTERAEERLQILFPDTPVLRIDRDSTTRKGSMDALLSTIGSGEPCIMVGTQMLAKGHHFPRVTLVAILNADGGLFSADFRASERMAQLITQVAGRAGRAGDPGRVIIQSQLADHPLLVQLSEQGYFAFAEQALSERRATGLPPFSHLALLRADALKAEHADAFLEDAYSIAEQLLEQLKLEGVELLGPITSPMERRAGRYRAQLLVQANSRAQLHRLLTPLSSNLENLTSAWQSRWSLDVDPNDLF
ncbi:primosomal protein N' [Pseudomonas sp. C27(2019)]|uniref:primosomal protein N' n=1 Tax=Pseudomonas sp. C27(2019) TaxID=2604941 RepID=UPI0012493F34|nr:primosomal protein N' [Pseudomonas sp. C27(2019)]QEY59753.1 primosomal protein N' [Pseudomonas sp. C27(2019)]